MHCLVIYLCYQIKNMKIETMARREAICQLKMDNFVRLNSSRIRRSSWKILDQEFDEETCNGHHFASLYEDTDQDPVLGESRRPERVRTRSQRNRANAGSGMSNAVQGRHE